MIKINFCDMYRWYDFDSDIFAEYINKHFGGYEISDEPDFLFYGPFGTRHHLYKNCVKIFICGEPLAPDFNQCDYAIGYDPIEFGDRYMRRPIYIQDSMPEVIKITDEQALNRKFCNFVYSNDKNGVGAKLRVEFAKKLMKYKHVDCPGKILNNMKDAIGGRTGANWIQDKLDFIGGYKFTIAFENSMASGYTTEKMIHPLSAHSIPIYWGNPDVANDFNENAFINATGYEDCLDEVIQKVIELDNNDEAYLKMLHAAPMTSNFDVNEMDKLEQFIVNIIKKGNKPYEKDVFGFTTRMSVDSLSRKEKIRYFFFK